MGKEPVPAGEGSPGKTVTPPVLPRLRPRWTNFLSGLHCNNAKPPDSEGHAKLETW